MRFIKSKIVLLVVAGTCILASCGFEENNEEIVDDAQQPAAEGEALIEPEQLGTAILEEEVEKVYNQLSEEFQNELSFNDLEGLVASFNEGVEEYKLQSQVPVQNDTHYTWVDQSDSKGIMAIFDKEQTITGLLFLPLETFPETDQQFTQTEFILPIQEEWFVFWGGANELVNYHYAHENQRYAIDLVIMDEDQTYAGDPTKNESYYAFGKELIAPAAGTVVEIENNIADNEVGDMNSEQPFGNYVMIDHGNDEFSVIAHMQEHSIQVEAGDKVERGDVLGFSGNSGNSSEPHIHFQVNNSPDLEESQSIRIQFENNETPTRGDFVQPAN